MKKEELPQDDSALNNVTKELHYIKDKTGKYTTGLSSGWDVKKEALDNTWDDIKHRIEETKKQVLNNEISPIEYFMELRLMDLTVLAGYTGFWKWTIKRDFNPEKFNKMNKKRLQKYADAFEITVQQLQNVELDH